MTLHWKRHLEYKNAFLDLLRILNNQNDRLSTLWKHSLNGKNFNLPIGVFFYVLLSFLIQELPTPHDTISNKFMPKYFPILKQQQLFFVFPTHKYWQNIGLYKGEKIIFYGFE